MHTPEQLREKIIKKFQEDTGDISTNTLASLLMALDTELEWLRKEVEKLHEQEKENAGYSRVEASIYSWLKGNNYALNKVLELINKLK